MIHIKDISGNIILSVSISQECEHVEELMKSDYIQLSWSSDNSDTIPAGSYIEYKGEKYSLLEPYSPKQKDEAEFTYQPQFQSKIMIWGKTPFFMYTYADDVITNREPDWSLTDNPANFMSVVVDAIKNETGEIWTYSVESSLPASTTQSFQSIDIFSALNQIANAFETEWWVDKINKVIHLSKASHGDPVVLEVGENVNTPSVTSSKEGYYTRFYAFGSTRNIVQDYKGANVNNLVNKRLTLDPVKYPGGYKDIRDNLSSDEIFSKVLILDDIYPSSKLKISDVRVRLMWTIDPDTKEKVQIGTDSEGNPIYDQYAIWYFQIPGFSFDNTAYDKDINPQGMLIPGKTLSAHFQDGPLSGREFELKYHDKAESVDSADGAPIQIKKGDYEILFVKEDSLVIPMINNLVPADGNEVVLFNIRMPEEYTTSAYLDLESALNKEIERLSSDLNNYQFNSNPVAFDNSNPKLSLGRNITYKNGTYSYSTRVIKLVTKLDFEIEQTITVGNEQIKGNTQEIKEEIASANKDINLLAILNSTTNSLTQAYSRTQQLMLEGFASIKDMWKFDPDNADTIFSKYNVYSKKALSAKGLAEGSGGSGGGASALYQLVDVIPNSAGTGVEGAQDRFTLIYDALAGKWKAGEAGLNENQLAFYLSTNNYAKKSDIPSLAGYATEKWVMDKGYLVATASDKANWNTAYGWGNHTFAGYAKQTDLKTVSDKLNSFLSGESISDTIDNWKEFQKVFENFPDSANMVELLRGKVDITTSVKAGTGLTGGGPLSKDITLSLGETGVSVGAYTKLTVDKYGRVTSGTSLIASDIPSLAISKITGLQDALNSKLNSNDFQSKFDAAISAWFVRDTDNKGIRPAAYKGEEVGFYSNSYLSAKGYASGSGGGGGASALYQLLDVTPNASGTGVEGAVDKSVLTFDGTTKKWKAAKGLDEAALRDYLTTNKYATQSWVSSQGYLTQHQSLANYVTLNTDQEITGVKTFFSDNGNVRTIINGRDIITVHNSNYVGGWTRGLIFRKADGVTNYGTFGIYGSEQALNYLYIGQNYTNPWITFKDTLVKSNVTFEASSIRKTGGTSTQFLKADGSIDSNSYLTTVSAFSTYVRKVGDIMTGALTVPNLVISNTSPVKHIAFSRPDYNYITSPANSYIAFVTNGREISAPGSVLTIATTAIHPGTNNEILNGTSNLRWKGIYSVIGDFSGAVNCASSINASGEIRAEGSIISDTYIRSKAGWFQNDVAQTGLFNKAGDARWYWNGSYWYADKSIYSTDNVHGNRLVSRVATGYSPLLVNSTTLVTNLNANYVEGYNSSQLLRTKEIGSRPDFERYVILLFATDVETQQRVDGYFFTTQGGGNRYYRTDVSIWHSRWSSTGHDGTYSCINKNYQEGGLKLVTVTYQGKEWVAMDSGNTSIQAKKIYFTGDWTNAEFTLVSYYNTSTKVVLNAEINGSIKDLVSKNIQVGNNTVAYLSSNVASATKLQNARTLWGQSFDGTDNVTGELKSVTRVSNANGSNLFLGNSDGTGWVQAGNICASSGTTYWSLRTTGVGHLRRLNLGDAENDDSNYRLAVAGNLYINGSIVSPYYRINYSSTNPYYNITKDAKTAYFQLWDTKAYLGFGTATSLNITTDGKVGIGIGTTNPSYNLHVGGSGYFSGSITTSGNIATGGSDGAFVRVGNVYLQYDATNNAIKVVKYDGTSANLYATGGLSAQGYASGSGGGGGGGLIQNVYGYNDLGKTYSNADLDNTFNAYTINQIATRVTSLEGGSAMTFNTTGTGEFFSAVSKNGTTVTFTKTTPNYINSITTLRDIKPNSTGSGLLKLYFLTAANVGLASGYADCLFLNSYVDSSGGGSNLISFSKTNGEMGLHYQSFNSTTWGARRIVLESVNYTNYTVTKTGGGASGTWGIDISGTAANATNATTAAKVANSLTFAAGAFAAKTYNGSAAVSVNVPTHTSHLTNNSGYITSGASITGNAASATKLQTARSIAISGGATGIPTSFDGTSNITIPVTKIDPSKVYYESTADKLLIRNAVAQYTNDNSSINGIIKIILPTGWSSAMMGIEIDVYDYSSNGYSKVLVGGYNYTTPEWYNMSVSVLGSCSYRVRLGYDGSKCCILLGAANHTWHYPKVAVRNVISGFSGYASLGGDWSISFVTTETGLTNINEPVINNGMTVATSRTCSGNAATASKWATARSISLTGAITGSVSLDGSENVSLATTFTNSVFDARYVNKTGDTMTGTLSVPTLTISSQDSVEHIKFTRQNVNYITSPANSYIAFVTTGKSIGTANSDVIIGIERIYPGTNNLTNNGLSTNRWKGVYSVIGNFTGALTAGAGLEVTGSLKMVSDWVRFTKNGIGLYSETGDTRWYWNGSTWHADKAIDSTSTITGTRLISTIANGTAPLTVTSTTLVNNLNADLLDNYHASGLATANSVVIRDGNNYTYLKYINSSTNTDENGDLDQFIVTKPNDSFYRKYGRDYVRVKLNSFNDNRQIIDLSTLDANTYYPCSIRVEPYEPTTISIFVSLNSGTKPSWSTHTSGFTMNLSWQVFGGGWGTTSIQRKILNNYWQSTSNNVHPCGGIEQNTMASTEIVYLRGGAKYFYTISNTQNKFEINSSGYTWSSGNYSYSAALISAPKKSPSLCYEGSSMLGAYNIYCGYLQTNQISVDGTITASTFKTKDNNLFENGRLELSSATPYIDFHYGNSSADYTHRIIAETSDRLNVTTGLQVNGILYGNGNLDIGSPIISNIHPTSTNSWANLSNSSVVLAIGNYNVNKDTVQPIFRWANQIPEGYLTRYIIGSHRPSSAGFGQLRLWVGNNDAGTAGNWFALNNNGVVSTSLTYFETSNVGFKTGNAVFGATSTSVAEMSSGTNEMIFSSGLSTMHVNYRASGMSRTIPTAWYWHSGSSSSWCAFDIGALVVHGGTTIQGNTTIGGSLGVTGDIGAIGGITSTRMLTASGGLDVTDFAMFNDSIQVDGDASFNNPVTISALLNMNGNVTLNGIIRGNSSSRIICDGMGISSANKESGCIIAGNPNVWNIALDHNDIQARNNGTWSILYINDYGGDVSITNASSAYGVKILSTKASTAYNNGALTVGGGIGVGGNIYVGGSVIANGGISAKSASDKRLKTDFDRNVRYDERLLSLGCVLDYSYNDLALQRGEGGVDRKRHTGLIHENVERVMPQITFRSKDGYGSINYISPDFIATIAGATQLNTLGLRSVMSRTDKLEKRIKELENEIETLKKSR